MRRAIWAGTIVVTATLGAAVLAGPETVGLPEGYQDSFVNYLDVDRIDRKRVRRMWVNPAALETSVAGTPLPDGTILIMEDHEAQVDADGKLVFGDDGRLIALPEAGNRFVMEKNAAWDTANGNWDYAWYVADGTPRAEANFEGCFSCHANRDGSDFNFTFSRHVADSAR